MDTIIDPTKRIRQRAARALRLARGLRSSRLARVLDIGILRSVDDRRVRAWREEEEYHDGEYNAYKEVLGMI